MLSLKNVTFAYPNAAPVLQDISFEVPSGSHLSIMGSSGCGKSTLLKVIYGLLDVDRGDILFQQKKLFGPSHHLIPGHSFMKLVSQDFDLMPFTTVAENIAQYLSVFEQKTSAARVKELLDLIEMQDYANTACKFLSGGQKQRIALAKAIAQEPKVLLLDEPFGHIDSFKKNELRRRLFRYLKKQQISVIVATHDKEDVLPFADKVMIIKNNRIWKFDTPQQLYTNKPDRYTANLFGDVSQLEENGKWYYPEELEICDYSAYKVRVKDCYFWGNSYLLQTQQGNRTIYLCHSQKKTKNDLVYIQIRSSAIS